MIVGEKNAAISGIGQSALGRSVPGSGLALTIDAVIASLDDAGLKPADIDGISTWPGRSDQRPNFSPVGVTELKEALRLELNWFAGGPEGPGQFSSIINAVMAVATGQARHVICFRTLREGSGRKEAAAAPAGPPARASGYLSWLQPFRSYSTMGIQAMQAKLYMDRYGVRREQLAQIALNARRNAVLNPNAIYREPLTLDQYLAARPIIEPFCLYDCDVPIDGSTAIIVSHKDAARDCRRAPIHIEAMSGALHGRDSWDQRSDLTTMAAHDAAARLWQRTDLTPDDVDVAELYDGFSSLTLFWLEAMGFCAKGEAGAFVEGGGRIGLDGQLPLNTHGGQLSAGRMHGFGLLHEACVQLRGDGGLRQVRHKPVNMAAVAAGGGPLAGCMLLRND